MPGPVRWCRSHAAASRRTGTLRPTRASWSWLKRATCPSDGRAGPVCVTAVKAGWCRARSSMTRSHLTNPPTATSSCAAHSRVATSSSICDVWPHVEDEGGADQREAETRRRERDHRRGREYCQDDERSPPRDTPHPLGYERGVCAGQNLALEDVVGNVDAHEQARVKRHRGASEPGTGDPGGCKGQERHHEEMNEVDPDQPQRRSTHKPHQVVMVDPDDGDEQVAHRIADGGGPQRPESRECRLLWRFELQDHDGHNDRENRI